MRCTGIVLALLLALAVAFPLVACSQIRPATQSDIQDVRDEVHDAFDAQHRTYVDGLAAGKTPDAATADAFDAGGTTSGANAEKGRTKNTENDEKMTSVFGVAPAWVEVLAALAAALYGQSKVRNVTRKRDLAKVAEPKLMIGSAAATPKPA